MRIIRTFGHAFRGIYLLLRTERNFQIQFWISVVVVIVGFFVKLSDTHWVIVLMCMAMVLGLEAVNTAIERTLDTLHPERDERIRNVKDIAAGAVLTASILAVVVGLLVFIPYLVNLR